MGFKPPKKIYKLQFETEELDGLEVRARSMSIGQYGKLLKLFITFDSDSTDGAVVDKLFGEFSKCLVSWNVEDEDGSPVPTTLEGLKTQDMNFIMQIFMAWMKAISGVPAPLLGGSKNGATSQEQSLGLGAISQSRRS